MEAGPDFLSRIQITASRKLNLAMLSREARAGRRGEAWKRRERERDKERRAL
jgi:hypothetical protein